MKHSAPSLSESGAFFLKPGLEPSNPLGLNSCFCDELCLHSVKGNELPWREEQDFFSLIQLNHMLTAILSPLSKAAGTFAISSPLLRLQVSWGSPGDRDEVVESQGQRNGKGGSPGRLGD